MRPAFSQETLCDWSGTASSPNHHSGARRPCTSSVHARHDARARSQLSLVALRSKCTLCD
jgi:hypothetical protein